MGSATEFWKACCGCPLRLPFALRLPCFSHLPFSFQPLTCVVSPLLAPAMFHVDSTWLFSWLPSSLRSLIGGKGVIARSLVDGLFSTTVFNAMRFFQGVANANRYLVSTEAIPWKAKTQLSYCLCLFDTSVWQSLLNLGKLWLFGMNRSLQQRLSHAKLNTISWLITTTVSIFACLLDCCSQLLPSINSWSSPSSTSWT